MAISAMLPGWLAFEQEPILGIGPGNLRSYVSGQISIDLMNVTHPHNYYIQLLGETGIVGLITGCLFWFDHLGLCPAGLARPQ